MAAIPQRQLAGPESIVQGGSSDLAKSAVDTVLLIGPYGSGALHNGQFETSGGAADWQGWTSRDLTHRTENAWHISTYHAAGLNGHGEGNSALWCGSDQFPVCNENDEAGGYGNNYYEIIEWYGTVENPAAPCQVQVEAWLNQDLEPGYDYLYLKALFADESAAIFWQADGQLLNYHLSGSISYAAGDYVGPQGDQVHLQLVVISDSAFSDEDCLWPGFGACQVDDIRVQMDNGAVESLSDFEDGSLGDWTLGEPPYVGDFAKLWMNLEDVDACRSNSSAQVAFIDDGQVVPGTGGTICWDWCYGPGGYILNNSGGLMGPDGHLNNIVLSPVIDVSGLGTAGYLLEYDFYDHVTLDFDDAGIFTKWGVRSTASMDPQDLENAPWVNNNIYYLSPGVYQRAHWDLSSQVVPDARFIQISLGAEEIGYAFGFDGINGTPAPYYDNVRLSAYPQSGPYLWARALELAQDAFPANGHLNLEDPAAGSVRFDGPGLEGAAGDSIVCRVTPVRPDAVLVGAPLLHYSLKANPAFDPYRTTGLPPQGAVEGWPVLDSEGTPRPDLFAFDLPDTGFLFPGDVLHYFISGTDDRLGEQRTSTLPADTTGFYNLDDPLAFDPLFTVQALPTITGSGESFIQPARVLFWDDGGRSGRKEWFSALRNNGLQTGVNCDVFFTNDSSAGENNGLGGRATLEQLAGYSAILYTSGTNSQGTLVESDATLIHQWLGLPDKHLLATGDGLASDLHFSSPAAQELLDDSFGVEVVSRSLSPRIHNQKAPKVVAEYGIPPLYSSQSWLANGGCPWINSFDAVEAGPNATRLASFTNLDGNPDFSFSAATVCENHGSVVSLPYAFEYIWNDPAGQSNPYSMSARSWLLRQVLDYFGILPTIYISDTPEILGLWSENYPNPFNPSTTIRYSLPRATHLSIRIFDLRGQLVTTLMDEQRPAGPGLVEWTGVDKQGGEVSSGVYFYELRTEDDVRISKMALIK